MYDEMRNPDEMYKKQIGSILINDWEFVKLQGYLNTPPIIAYRDWKKGKLGRRARPSKNLVQIKEQYLNVA
jgi:hypothetical protein